MVGLGMAPADRSGSAAAETFPPRGPRGAFSFCLLRARAVLWRMRLLKLEAVRPSREARSGKPLLIQGSRTR